MPGSSRSDRANLWRRLEAKPECPEWVDCGLSAFVICSKESGRCSASRLRDYRSDEKVSGPNRNHCEGAVNAPPEPLARNAVASDDAFTGRPSTRYRGREERCYQRQPNQHEGILPAARMSANGKRGRLRERPTRVESRHPAERPRALPSAAWLAGSDGLFGPDASGSSGTGLKIGLAGVARSASRCISLKSEEQLLLPVRFDRREGKGRSENRLHVHVTQLLQRWEDHSTSGSRLLL